MKDSYDILLDPTTKFQTFKGRLNFILDNMGIEKFGQSDTKQVVTEWFIDNRDSIAKFLGRVENAETKGRETNNIKSSFLAIIEQYYQVPFDQISSDVLQGLLKQFDRVRKAVQFETDNDKPLTSQLLKDFDEWRYLTTGAVSGKKQNVGTVKQSIQSPAYKGVYDIINNRLQELITQPVTVDTEQKSSGSNIVTLADLNQPTDQAESKTEEVKQDSTLSGSGTQEKKTKITCFLVNKISLIFIYLHCI